MLTELGQGDNLQLGATFALKVLKEHATLLNFRVQEDRRARGRTYVVEHLLLTSPLAVV